MRKVNRGLSSRVFVTLLLACGVWSCGGGGSSNEQGVAFTFLGFFGSAPEDNCEGITDLISRLSTTISESQDEGGESAGGTVAAVIGLQNNLTGQFIRAQRVFLSFFIPGADEQPPSTNSNAAALILPLAPGEDGAGFDSSLPPAFGEEDCNRAYTTIAVVPGEIREWINLNRSSLPEAPFTMVVDATVSAVTSAGDRLDSNTVEIFVDFLPDNLIPPTEGEDDVDDGGAGA